MADSSGAKWVYSFGAGKAEGAASMKNLLGGKGANLAEMSSLGLPVPPGFTITTEVCTVFYERGKKYPDDLAAAVNAALATVEADVGKKFGDPANPLLVSVRSGARASMPGMMDTVLNLGLNDDTVKGLAALANDERFAFDSYRRFITMYSSVVLNIGHHHFEDVLSTYKDDHEYKNDTDLTADDWRKLVSEYKSIVQRRLGRPFPQDPAEQLWGAIGAVFDSWMNDRAKVYRKNYDIPESWGTAVNVQAMVFGNMGETSATGVAFTRNPNTGEKIFFGEYLINAQGEDVVAGTRTPGPITNASKESQGNDAKALEDAMPAVYAQLVEVYQKLENHYRDMQDIEFTVEQSKLWMLQTRSGKRTTKAALKIAVDMVKDGMISKEEAISRIDPMSLDQLLHPTIDTSAGKDGKSKLDQIAKGLPASPGAALGRIVFDSEEAEKLNAAGEPVILVRDETSPEDIHGMIAARGILTARGGLTSHAAVVARGMGRPCVCGAGEIRINAKDKLFTVGGRTFRAGELITIDGGTGRVLFGEVPMVEPELSGDFAQLMEWADSIRRLKVRANAETPRDAETARQFGAEGIGLCRTEHMFFEADRIAAVREMILSDAKEGRVAALAKILPMQRKDFADLFRIMAGLPVTIRFLDPPLHEFLPHTEEDVAEVAKATGLDAKALLQRARELHEVNPMLGHRGCRLGITFPEIYEMQARAVFEAALIVAKEKGDAPIPEIMIPLIATKKELDILKARVDAVAQDVFKEQGAQVEYSVGTMIELPRAAIRADQIAETAAFFSFGTNDLTQTTIGISRDDAARFLNHYVDAGIFEKDPFVTLDQEGVGDLIQIAAERGRKTRPSIKLGICGEHGGDPASIAFCERLKLDYVSCSPYRTPIARLAAAQAVLQSKGSGNA